MQPDLDRAFQHCEQVARSSGSNFFLAFRTLPREMYLEMCALYAFMRHTDDISDHPSLPFAQRLAELENWQSQLTLALGGEQVEDQIILAMAETVRRKSIPHAYLYSAIEGVRSDLIPRTIVTFEELEHYCYQVAGVVGLCSVHIWGFNGPEPVAESVACGTAFQLTNILRDLSEDSSLGRIYLPLDDLQKFHYRDIDLAARRRNAEFEALMSFEVARAKGFYEQARSLKDKLSPEGQRIFAALFELYETLLLEIEKANYDVFSRRIRIPFWKKARIGLRMMLASRRTAS